MIFSIPTHYSDRNFPPSAGAILRIALAILKDCLAGEGDDPRITQYWLRDPRGRSTKRPSRVFLDKTHMYFNFPPCGQFFKGEIFSSPSTEGCPDGA
jgi:hypothetical protein